MNIFGLSVIFFVRKLSACTGSNTCHRNKEGKFNSYRNRDPYFNFRSISSELSHYSIIIMIMMMMMINFYSAISQWSNDALQKFMKNYNKLCHLLLHKNLHLFKTTRCDFKCTPHLHPRYDYRQMYLHHRYTVIVMSHLLDNGCFSSR